ncbi:MAG: hypothetical protein QNJ54_32885 [Prochloraceae cyanobacterium]|nr:hypothetical protein [Prochloraceae cyanobacterium]
MSDRRKPDPLLTEFRRERSIRRTVKVLEAKRKRIRDELEQLIAHAAMLIPLEKSSISANQTNSDLLQEAVERMGDDAFAQLLLQILREGN